MISHVTLLSIPILSSPKVELLAELKKYIQEKKSFTLFTPNPEILVRAYKDREFAQILRNNEFNIPDGVGISLFTRIPSIKGRVLMEDLFKLLETEHESAYVIGSEPAVIEKVLHKTNETYPNLTIHGNAGPLLDKYGISINGEQLLIQEHIEKELERLKPAVVFVGFGAPKQEYWINKMKEKFSTISWMAVGGSLDTYSGVKSVPPHWMEQLHLEWLYRLIQEPKRIGRIMNAVMVFPFYVLLDRMSVVNSHQ